MEALRMRPFRYETDLEKLYAYMTEPYTQALFSNKMQINTLQAFERWITEMLHTEYHDFFMIENASGNTVGFTFSYAFFPNDRHCKFTLCLFEEYVNHGVGVIAAAQMIDYLFSAYSLNQIFTAVFAYNQESLSVHQNSGFCKVGELPNYRFFNGSYHSLHWYVMEKEVFYHRAKQLLERIKKN